jgi:hypothetical protein
MAKPIAGIYRITEVSTGRHYVGESGNLKTAWYQHKSNLKCRRHSNSYLQTAWNDSPLGSVWEFVVLELCDDRFLRQSKVETYCGIYAAYTKGFNVLLWGLVNKVNRCRRPRYLRHPEPTGPMQFDIDPIGELH